MRIIPPCLLVILISGCGSWNFPWAYRIAVEQGNVVTPEMVAQLKPGMTRRQVRYVLGTPLLEDSFNRSRWDYIYTLSRGTEQKASNLLTIYFTEDGTLAHFDSSIAPSAETPAAAITEPEPEPAAATAPLGTEEEDVQRRHRAIRSSLPGLDGANAAADPDEAEESVAAPAAEAAPEAEGAAPAAEAEPEAEGAAAEPGAEAPAPAAEESADNTTP